MVFVGAGPGEGAVCAGAGGGVGAVCAADMGGSVAKLAARLPIGDGVERFEELLKDSCNALEERATFEQTSSGGRERR